MFCKVLRPFTTEHSSLCSRQILSKIQKHWLSMSRTMQADDSSVPVAPVAGALEVPTEYADTHMPMRAALPFITSRDIEFPNPYIRPKQAWLESLSTIKGEKLGIIDLHPDIFGCHPRLDILYKNINWQKDYRVIDYATSLTRAEVRGGGRKPWQQKRTGRHRAGSIRAPQWKGGGLSHGPRGPKSLYYMIPQTDRVWALRTALTVKYAQGDLHIVDSLEIPTEDPEYIEDLMDTRYWGFSGLFIDDTDFMPRNISMALDALEQFNLMPVYGLNCWSILKHDTLVLTLAAVEKIEHKLLRQIHHPKPNFPHKP